MKRIILALCAVTMGLSACSTVNKINPFKESEKDKKSKQGILPDEKRRISVLSYEQGLKKDEAAANLPFLLPPPYVNSDWAQTGAFPSHAPQNLTTGDALKVVWKKSIGSSSGTNGRIVAPPVLAGGRLFVMDARGVVRALDAKTGKPLWRYTIKRKKVVLPKEDRRGRFDAGWRSFLPFRGGNGREGYGGGLAVSGGHLYLVSGQSLAVALDVVTGDEIWRTLTPTPIHSAPTVADGRMFAVTQDDELYAFDIKTGEILWTFQGISEPAKIMAASSPAVYGEVVVAPFASGELVAFRVQNGRTIWTDSLTRTSGLTALSDLNDIAGAPVIFDRTVFAISHSGLLTAINLRTGARLWSRQVGGINMPWLAGDNLFVMTNDGQIAALSRYDGSVRWARDLPRYRKVKKRKDRIAWSGPVLANGKLLLVSSKGKLLKISPETGETLSEKKLGGRFFIAPVIADKSVYLLSDQARLYKLQ